MNQPSDVTTPKHNIWLRGVFMVLMAMVCQLCGTILFFVAVIQFVIVLLNNPPNARLLAFGRSLGSYIRQITNYLTFVSEELPFPFADWPSAKGRAWPADPHGVDHLCRPTLLLALVMSDSGSSRSGDVRVYVPKG